MKQKDQLMNGVEQLSKKLDWLNRLMMEDALKECKPSEVHCIEYIANNSAANVTKLATHFYMTRGAISKLTKKLINRGYLESYVKDDNRKEIYFRLTAKGQKIEQIHQELHQKIDSRDEVVFTKIKAEQFKALLSFVAEYNEHLDEEIKKVK